MTKEDIIKALAEKGIHEPDSHDYDNPDEYLAKLKSYHECFRLAMNDIVKNKDMRPKREQPKEPDKIL